MGMRELTVQLNENGRITSVELVEIINTFRQIEKGDEYKELRHDSFVTKIKKELKTLESIGLNSLQNILESTYTNNRGKVYNCYSLNRDGMLQMLNSESTLVRYKTIEYINKLENQLKEKDTPKLPNTYLEALEALVESEKQKQLQAKQLEEQKPLVQFANKVANSSDCIDFGTFSKIIKEEGIKLGRNKLFEKLRDIGLLMKNNVPYQRYIDNKCFEVREYIISTAYGEKIKTQTLITGKGQIYLTEKLREISI